jgi:glutathione peroxidase
MISAEQSCVPLQNITGSYMKMNKFKGKVLLIVNVASECGFTPQYGELAALYDKYKKNGFEVLAAPCNQFGGQEPKSDAEIKKFAQSKGANFPMTAKLDVNGPDSTSPTNFLLTLYMISVYDKYTSVA